MVIGAEKRNQLQLTGEGGCPEPSWFGASFVCVLGRQHRTAAAQAHQGPARDLHDDETAIDGTGWDLRELRHSGLTYLGESGASLLELMAESATANPRTPVLPEPLIPGRGALP